jgi:hypothetical protein
LLDATETVTEFGETGEIKAGLYLSGDGRGEERGLLKGLLETTEAAADFGRIGESGEWQDDGRVDERKGLFDATETVAEMGGAYEDGDLTYMSGDGGVESDGG